VGSCLEVKYFFRAIQRLTKVDGKTFRPDYLQ
jgi:hypothetical protein